MRFLNKVLKKNIKIKISKNAKKWLAKKCNASKFGARPLKRLIQNKIKNPLSDHILFGKLSKGGKVSIELKKDQLFFKIS